MIYKFQKLNENLRVHPNNNKKIINKCNNSIINNYLIPNSNNNKRLSYIKK